MTNLESVQNARNDVKSVPRARVPTLIRSYVDLWAYRVPRARTAANGPTATLSGSRFKFFGSHHEQPGQPLVWVPTVSGVQQTGNSYTRDACYQLAVDIFCVFENYLYRILEGFKNILVSEFWFSKKNISSEDVTGIPLIILAVGTSLQFDPRGFTGGRWRIDKANKYGRETSQWGTFISGYWDQLEKFRQVETLPSRIRLNLWSWRLRLVFSFSNSPWNEINKINQLFVQFESITTSPGSQHRHVSFNLGLPQTLRAVTVSQ